MKTLRVAFVHDWLVGWRGGEKVLATLASMYPDAPIYTLFHDPQNLPASFGNHKVIVHTSANRFRFMRKALLPLMPLWIESLPLDNYDLVISTSSCVAKGVMVGPYTKHLCYIHSPMRYIWDQRDAYLGRVRRLPIIGLLIEGVSSLLRMWDITSATRVDLFVANSSFIQQRVRRYYSRDAVVVHPPIDIERFTPPDDQKKGGYLLAAGALVGYKRFDLAIKAAELTGKRLIIAGDGPDLAHLRSIAGSKTEFVIKPSNEVWVELLRGADALLFPGIEDFGMVAVEAMAAGTPVIALKAGGALDFIVDSTSGLFFEESSPQSLADAIQRAAEIPWSAEALMRHAQGFSTEYFLKNMRRHLEKLLSSPINF